MIFRFVVINQNYLATLLELLKGEFVVMIFVHLIKDFLNPFLRRVFIFADGLLSLQDMYMKCLRPAFEDSRSMYLVLTTIW